MTDDNHRRRKYEGVTEHALLRTGLRFAMVIGTGVASFLFLQVWDGQKSMQAVLSEVGRIVAVVAIKTENNGADIKEQGDRIQYIERKLWARRRPK